MTDELREALARYSHDTSWSGWMRYMFSKCVRNEDGSVTIPAASVDRWTRQMNTAYNDLPESERASDLEQADAILSLPELAALRAELDALRPLAEAAKRSFVLNSKEADLDLVKAAGNYALLVLSETL